MTPISRLINSLGDLFSKTLSSVIHMFEKMDMVQFAALSICALAVAALCLRGNPVRGA